MKDDSPSTPDEETPVGFGNPPKEWRWAPGYCPNRKGRPARKRIQEMKRAPIPSEIERRILEDARKVVANRNGKDIDRIDFLLLELYSKRDQPAIAKLLLDRYLQASKAEQDFQTSLLSDVLAYKAHWGPIFAKARKLGKPLPAGVYPDPDDIIILADHTVIFIGPITEDEARRWERYWDWREMVLQFTRDIIESAGLFRPLEKDKANYLRFRRLFYRYNRHIPEEFKRKFPVRFPAFEPPASPPAWYEDEDRLLTGQERRALEKQHKQDAKEYQLRKFRAFGRLL